MRSVIFIVAFSMVVQFVLAAPTASIENIKAEHHVFSSRAPKKTDGEEEHQHSSSEPSTRRKSSPESLQPSRLGPGIEVSGP
ncbi:hypothetical protein DFH28DRAFT_961203 [Melampsora americana]|nr:hypothetical protein DFH28DRAFT_961203 [Melampsora americana]